MKTRPCGWCNRYTGSVDGKGEPCCRWCALGVPRPPASEFSRGNGGAHRPAGATGPFAPWGGIVAAARSLGITRQALHKRLAAGLTPAEAIAWPKRKPLPKRKSEAA